MAQSCQRTGRLERGVALWAPQINSRSSNGMHALQTAIAIVWIIFWVYWLASAFGVKEGRGGRRRIPLTGLTALSVVLLLRVFRGGSLGVNSPVLGAVGAVVFALGLALAVWARVHLGRNWGMPMTQKAEPELVTTGPYRFVRHPIYSGLLAGVLGTALATNLIGLIVVVVLGGYFYYSASVEEKNLTATFPTAYPAYQSRTKMLIPLVL
jgi:protein-S-isoprenylcysteine O-methyltransferase Ste14